MSTERQATIEKLVADENVKHIQLWFTDILGNLKMVEVPDRQLSGVIENGAAFDGSSISGLRGDRGVGHRSYARLELLQDPPLVVGQREDGIRLLRRPRPRLQAIRGRPSLRAQAPAPARRRHLGLEMFVGPELEYFYFRSSESPELVDEGGYFDVLPDDLGNDLRKQTMRALDRLGIPMEASHHEVAPSQHEIDPHYDEALIMADRVMVCPPHRQGSRRPQRRARHLHAQAYARRERQWHARAPMPLPRRSTTPSSATSDPDHLSDLAKSFIAGQLKHMREISSMLNQYVNSFKRLVPGYEAPVYISWAHRNRTALSACRCTCQGKESTVRAELRNPDPAANPYLAFAVMLGAGLEGMEKGYELPPRWSPTSTR